MAKKKGIKLFEQMSETDTEKKESVTDVVRKPGRRSELANNRNRKMACRYYYYTSILKYSYENTMQALENDFDLSKITIIEIVERLTDNLKELKVKKVNREELEEAFPSFNWRHKAVVLTPQIPKQREVFILS
ncbi:hypothetical protein CJD36_008220 [Flavipsychrobacter stenotrophus]|uniref:Uncharacterized protein n=1 Tax=Flavipsychrobacter stenotrophus TaxID=2077091 RepID=A0A2S7SXW7_9BACT|nr:hypothetical protein [Flavipsychrobacter stenotrophus]PQJ11770.1 hypothetical protein CJD36_008220 [Flavipsychrobacter stenotrophus]